MNIPTNIGQALQQAHNARAFKRWIILGSIVAVVSIIVLISFFGGSVSETFDQLINSTTATVVVGILLVGLIASWLVDVKPQGSSSDSPIASSFFVRLGIFLVWHAFLYFLGQLFLIEFVYYLAGQDGFWASTGEFIVTIFIGWSAISSVDFGSVGLNRAAELLYLNMPVFSNLGSGPILLGLPSMFTTLKVVEFENEMIEIGVIKGKQDKPNIFEMNGFRVKAKILFRCQPIHTRLYLKIEGGEDAIERGLVKEMNAVVDAILNSSTYDALGKVVSKRFPDVESVKGANLVIAEDIMSGYGISDDNQTAVARFAKLGYRLLSVAVTSIENENTAIIDAEQQLKAERFRQDRKKLDMDGTNQTTIETYRRLNGLDEKATIPVAKDREVISMKECLAASQLDEKKRSAVDIGNGRALVRVKQP